MTQLWRVSNKRRIQFNVCIFAAQAMIPIRFCDLLHVDWYSDMYLSAEGVIPRMQYDWWLYTADPLISIMIGGFESSS